MTKLYLFTDGGSYPKADSKFDATSAFRFYGDDKKLLLSEARVHIDLTNQYGELAALRHGLDRVANYVKNSKSKGFTLNIYTDSMYAFKCLTEWIHSWMKNQKNGVFISSKNEPVKHQDIIKEAFASLQYISGKGIVKFHHINSHVNIKDLPKLKKKFEKVNNCKLDDETFLFIYKGNYDCDEDTKKIYEEFKKNEFQIKKHMGYDMGEIVEYSTF